MQKKKFLTSSFGSAPLELASFGALLVLPIAPMLTLYGAIFDAIAAESIARHALRAAVLESAPSQLDQSITDAVAILSKNWQRTVSFTVECGECKKGDLVLLRVEVGNSVAIQVAGSEPK